jgi:hypothetical protein
MKIILLRAAFVPALILFLSSGLRPVMGQSRWVHPGPDGKLIYLRSPQGDRVTDFSSAGYEGGGVALPVVPSKRPVAPSGGDDTAAIQKAIDEVSALPLTAGLRGAVELAPGVFHCSGTLTITASGVVLRGAGNGAEGSTLQMIGGPHLALRIAGHLEQKQTSVQTTVADAYVPSGTRILHLADASKLHPGDMVVIDKPVTATWIRFMGMDDLNREGRDEHWIGKDHLEVRRRIAAVKDNTVLLEIPLLDNYDAKFFEDRPVAVDKVEVSGQIAQVGVENLRIVAPKRSIALDDPHYDGLAMKDAVDSWLQAVNFEETTNSVEIGSGTERVTVRGCDVTQHEPVTSSAKPFGISVNGSQILIDRCTGHGNEIFFVATQARQQGPVVVLHCRFTGNGHIQPHQRWSTGLLVDNCEVPEGGIDFKNRGIMGSGHGWAIGWAVAWNNSAKTLEMNEPPAVANWSIGNRGAQSNPPMPMRGKEKLLLNGAITESAEKPVQPQSLYLAQLAERLGATAVKNIGYD